MYRYQLAAMRLRISQHSDIFWNVPCLLRSRLQVLDSVLSGAREVVRQQTGSSTSMKYLMGCGSLGTPLRVNEKLEVQPVKPWDPIRWLVFIDRCQVCMKRLSSPKTVLVSRLYKRVVCETKGHKQIKACSL